MKRTLIVFFLAFFIVNFSGLGQSEAQLVEYCIGQNADVTYLKDFVVKLDAKVPGEPDPKFRTSMVLSKNTEYKFSICDADESEGRGVIQLYDNNLLLGSTYNPATGKEYPGFSFKCQKTGVYHIFISFQNGKEGYTVGILSFVKRL